MHITIRQAHPMDAKVVVPLIVEAIGDIAKRLTGEDEPAAVERELEILFTREDNRHSYLHTFVAVADEKIVGILVYYHGEQAKTLDANLMQWLSSKNAATTIIDKEAHEDEYYVDTICVAPEARGKGIGSLLLQFAIDQTKERGYHKLSLNVETQKEQAIRLYERVGFVITEPWTIIDEPFHHMVKEI